MRTLTVADEVVPAIYSLSVKQRFAETQLILACGDLPFYYLEYIVTMLAAPCFFVFGNHDHSEHTADGQVIHAPQGCTSIEGRTWNHHGLLIGGLGGCLYYNGEGKHQFTETQMAHRAWRLVPRLLFNRQRHGRYLDVMLTHAPPLGIHNGPDLPHKGFQTFLALMRRFKPAYLIHGHIHKSYGFNATTESQYGNTQVINTAGYRNLILAPPQRSNPNEGRG